MSWFALSLATAVLLCCQMSACHARRHWGRQLDMSELECMQNKPIVSPASEPRAADWNARVPWNAFRAY